MIYAHVTLKSAACVKRPFSMSTTIQMLDHDRDGILKFSERLMLFKDRLVKFNLDLVVEAIIDGPAPVPRNLAGPREEAALAQFIIEQGVRA